MDLLHQLEKGKEELSPLQYHIKSIQYHIKTLQEEFAKKSNIPWIWKIIYGHNLSYMKKTRRKKQVCSAACFMAAEIKFSKDVRHTFLTTFPSSYHHEIFQELLPMTSDVYAKGQGQRSNFKVTRLKKIVDFDPNWAFPDCNSSLNSNMMMKWCTELDVARRGAHLFFKVISQISRLHC